MIVKNLVLQEEKMDFGETIAYVPCCICGIPIEPNPSNMCIDCLRSRCNFTDEVPSTSSLTYCRSCGRYQISPTQWKRADLESADLMEICLRKLQGTNDMRITNPQFLYTEPHSRRIRVQITLEKEALGGTILRQTLIVTFIVNLMQCPQCCEAATPREHWVANVQIRQESKNKRSLFWLEQQILTHHAHQQAINIVRTDNGIDFHFASKANAHNFIKFIEQRLPVPPFKEHAKLVGEDMQSNIKDSRSSYILRAPPISRQDLVLLPPELVRKSGNVSVVGVCLRVTRLLKFVDPVTAKVVEIDGPKYWNRPFPPLIQIDSLRPFVIISIENIGPPIGRFQLSDVEIVDEATYADRLLVRTHIGSQIHEGDIVLGYDLRAQNLPDEAIAAIKANGNVPDVILVGRLPSKALKKRAWHLKELAPLKQEDEEDFSKFQDELEQNPELREGITFYKTEGAENDPEVEETAIKFSEMKIDQNPEMHYMYMADPNGDE